ncbi:golgin candidate 4-like isoform X2 [Camellia sinensis]|uniref:golgin candidate 4-like isoform X2 n=1 Tax=Camellia sinensis TaxID=4442 RepID=UPI0010358739|nr:golgin candidate 4-like isoform X2 [Camellia sinensis]
MMWSTIANLKENLNKIALDVHDDDDDDEQGIEIYNSPDRTRLSRNFSHSSPASRSPLANGFDSHHNSEIEQYKAQIKRLQESEAEIKVLSVNYAALLKEKEDWISRLNEENGLLKQNLDATNATLNASRNESLKTSTNSLNGLKGSSDHSPNRQYKAIVKNRPIGNQSNNGFVSKQDGLCNGIQGNEKEDPADLLEQKNRSLAVIQADLESQIKKLGLELEKERGKLANIHLQLQDEQKLNGSFQDELNLLKVDKDKSTIEMKKIRDVLNEKISEVRRLQMELNRRDNIEADDTAEGLKRVIAALEKENNSLKMAKVELETSLKAANENSNKQSTSLSENVQSLGSFPGKEEMELSLQKLEKDLKETGQQRDKALQELSRLKKHLLDKEIEESEKMDEDSKIIEELKEKNEYQRLQILHLEKALKQAIAGQEEVKMINNNELQKYKEIIDDLNRKLTSCMSTIDAKNVELLNLQTALGSYYAELEAKEHLEGDLAHAREESAKLAELLKDAHQKAEISRKEKEDILEKLSQSERILAEGRNRVNKLEEDNAKLRRALEQSMSRLNRMSMDSDYFVDRRIVIKLLVTYFQRNHSKEVLDLMVRMLGFSDEDKQRIGVAQQGGKGVVRGVLGLPGRLVGGFLGGSSAEANQNMASENQSFADLWVDFLLKETEERERRESAEANASKEDQQKRSPNDMGSASPVPDQRTNATTAAFSNLSPSLNQNRSPLPSRGNILQSEHSDSEFSTVPLTSSERASQFSRRY